MSTTAPLAARPVPPGRQDRRAALQLLGGAFAALWIIEIFNTLDSNRLDGDGIHARSISHLWGILTSPLIHASFAHLISNSLPFLFCGAIIALRGVRRLVQVTAVVVLAGGLGTWLIGPGHASTIGASGVVFGYATYLIARGAFSWRPLELLVGVIVAVVLGGVLVSSLVPHQGVSWQAHLCGGIAGVVAAYLLGDEARRRKAGAGIPLGAGAGIARRRRAI